MTKIKIPTIRIPIRYHSRGPLCGDGLDLDSLYVSHQDVILHLREVLQLKVLKCT